MADTQSIREKLLNWPAGRSFKKFVPSFLKRLVKEVIVSGHYAIVNLGDDAKFFFPLNDSYWTQFQNDIKRYERIMWFVMEKFLNSKSIFIDGGANMGLWSCVAASKIKNPDQVVAVEVCDRVLRVLEKNKTANSMSFTVIERAIWSESDKSVTFYEYGCHAANSLRQDNLPEKPLRHKEVKTISVDDIVSGVLKKLQKKYEDFNVVVKLDVEGVEPEAMKGASDTLSRMNAMFIYEDHGKDKSSATTATFLNQGMHVYAFEFQSNKVITINDIAQLRHIKVNPRIGYNFIACMPGSGFDTELSAVCIDKMTVASLA